MLQAVEELVQYSFGEIQNWIQRRQLFMAQRRCKLLLVVASQFLFFEKDSLSDIFYRYHLATEFILKLYLWDLDLYHLGQAVIS